MQHQPLVHRHPTFPRLNWFWRGRKLHVSLTGRDGLRPGGNTARTGVVAFIASETAVVPGFGDQIELIGSGEFDMAVGVVELGELRLASVTTTNSGAIAEQLRHRLRLGLVPLTICGIQRLPDAVALHHALRAERDLRRGRCARDNRRPVSRAGERGRRNLELAIARWGRRRALCTTLSRIVNSSIGVRW
jgi:hypothetical protein